MKKIKSYIKACEQSRELAVALGEMELAESQGRTLLILNAQLILLNEFKKLSNPSVQKKEGK